MNFWIVYRPSVLINIQDSISIEYIKNQVVMSIIVHNFVHNYILKL
jgi:hypothetical protein